MTITLEIHEGVLAAIKKLKTSHEENVEFIIPEGSVLFENSLNLKLLKKEAEVLKKEISFVTSDEAGQTIIDFIEGEGEGSSSDFVSRTVTLDEVSGGGVMGGKRKLPIPLPVISLAFLKNLRPPQASLKGKTPLIMGLAVLVAALSFGVYHLFWKVPKAEIRVVVNSQPLIKSVEIQVKPNVQNDVTGHVLAGKIVEGVLVESKTTPTTGEKTVGEKATGKIKIENWSVTADKDFDSGERLYSKDDDDLFYTLDDDVTVPHGEQAEGTKTAGTAEVEVTAVEIGSDYNLDDGKSLEFEDFDPDDFTAEVVEDIDGGSSDIVSVVSQVDMDTLSDEYP